MCIQPHLLAQILRGLGWGEKREGRPPLPLFGNRRKFPDFVKKDPGPGCAHLWVTFCNQNMNILQSKYDFNSNSEASFSCVFNKMFIEIP